MSGSYTIYINGEGGYPQTRLLQKAPHVNIEPLAASMLLPMFVECTTPQSQKTQSLAVLSHPVFKRDGAMCQTLIRGWGCLPPNSCFYTVVV